jgi:hypothetical protein
VVNAKVSQQLLGANNNTSHSIHFTSPPPIHCLALRRPCCSASLLSLRAPMASIDSPLPFVLILYCTAELIPHPQPPNASSSPVFPPPQISHLSCPQHHLVPSKGTSSMPTIAVDGGPNTFGMLVAPFCKSLTPQLLTR